MDAARAEALVVEMREVFAFCDKDFDGKLSVEETVEAIRALGFAPSEVQLSALKETVQRVYPSGLVFSNFIKLLGSVVEPKVMRASDAGPAIMDGFRAFQELRGGDGTNTITKKDLKAFFGSLQREDPLAAEDLERFLRFTGNSGVSPSSSSSSSSAAQETMDYETLAEILMTAARAARA